MQAAGPPTPAQEIRFCRAPDGARIAYAVHGAGPPLLISTCWLSHLQYDWESPVWRHFLRDVGRFATVIRYDERGHGLSDWDVEDHSLEARVGDLTAVADDAGFDRFALMAMSQGGPPSVSYALRHPERVTRLMFVSSYASAFRDATAADYELSEAFEQLIKVGWARPDSVFRRVFTSLMIPDATEEQMRWLDELQRVSVSAETAYLSRRQRNQADVIDLLPELDVPTLVLHGRDDRMNGFEEGRHLAANIAGARLVALETSNHIVLEHEPAWPVFLHEVSQFLAADAEPATRRTTAPVAALSPRELEVLTLAAEGHDNDEIAGRLYLSVRTVERHFANIYAKLDVRGKSARTAAVARLLTSD
ncbi:Transcriptional regulator, LuxR family [metagenome]|uniref:Transcriptional regulator, LuxR family n=1 Tax=metagenome TaxID=256318 RepID=A0A2P2C569_9ZZZZ